MRWPRREGLGAGAARVLGAVQGPGGRQGQNRSTRAEATGARVLGLIRRPASRSRCASGATGRSRRSAPRTTRTSRASPRCARQKMHTITLPEALELFKLPRQLGRRGRRGDQRRHRPLRSLRQARQHLCLAEEGRRSLHHRTRARGVPDRARRKRSRQPHHQGIRRKRDPGAERQDRFGPYLSDGEFNGKIPKDREPASLTLEDAGGPLVSTSANLAGKPPPRTLAELDPSILAGIDGWLAGETGGLERPTPIRDARTGDVLRS
jgi:topoisomerase IA-like protein